MTQAVPEFQAALHELAAQAGGAGRELVRRIGGLTRAEGLSLISDAYPELMEPVVAASGEMTAQWYGETMPRPLRRVTGGRVFTPEPAELPSRNRLAKSGRWSILQRNPETAIEGVSTRFVFDASRRTVDDNAGRQGVRWVRYASSNACGFCRMLATRALQDVEYSYTSQATAEATPHVRDVRGHDHCKCIAVPRHNYEPPGYVLDWLDDYNAVSRDDDGHLLPEWKIADLMERRADERLGRVRRGRGRPRKPRVDAAPPGGAETASSRVVRNLRRGDAGQFAGNRALWQRRHERAAIIARATRDRVETAQRITARADSYVSTAAKVTGGIKKVADVADKTLGGVYPVLRDVRKVVDAADAALGSTARVTGGANRALTAVDRAIKDTADIAHGVKQIVDDAASVVDDALYVATGVRALIGDAGKAARAATDLSDVDGLTDLVDKARATANTATGLYARGEDLVDRAQGAWWTLRNLPDEVAELPSVLLAPIDDARRVGRNLRETAESAGVAVDDAARLARSVRALAEALAAHRRFGSSADYTRRSAYAYATRVTDELDNAIGGGLAAPKSVEAARPPTWVTAERLDLPPAPPRAALPAAERDVIDVEVVPELPATPTMRALPAPPKPSKPRSLDDVEAELNAALEVGDDALVEQLVAEMEALEEAARRQAERAAKAAARREAADRAKWERVGELIEQGWDPVEAESEAFGITVEKIRRRNFIAEARAEGHKGAGFDELLSSVFAERAAEQFWQAEQATKGYMLKRRYEGRVDPADLWTVNERTARAWMSDEMAEWFDENGRITKAQLREAILSGRANWRNAMTEDFLQ